MPEDGEADAGAKALLPQRAAYLLQPDLLGTARTRDTTRDKKEVYMIEELALAIVRAVLAQKSEEALHLMDTLADEELREFVTALETLGMLGNALLGAREE